MSDLEKLEEMLAYWQPKLRLSDWDMKISMAPIGDMNGELAQVTLFLSRKSAHIRVSNLEGRSTPGLWPYDLENDLVHELLHAHLDTLDRCGDPKNEILQKIGLEQPIEILSGVLCGFRRASGHEFTWEAQF